MRSPVVVSAVSSASEADLIASHLRSQGIEAAARTHLDRSAYAGLGGATIMVPADQRIEAELELMLMRAAVPEEDAPIPSARPARTWLRVASYSVLAAMVITSALPPIAIIWNGVVG